MPVIYMDRASAESLTEKDIREIFLVICSKPIITVAAMIFRASWE